MSNFLRVMFVLCAMFGFGVQNASATQPNVNGTIDCSNATDTQFVPSWGRVEVSADQYGKYIIQWMYWDSYARLAWFINNGDSTFEPDAFFGGTNGETPYGYLPRNVSYGSGALGYWDSNLPARYQDTAWGDGGNEWAASVGSAQAVSLNRQTYYYTITRMADGGVNSGGVKLSAQRGRLSIPTFPPWVGFYSTWNSYGCSANSGTNNVFTLKWEDGFTAPGCRQYNYLWDITSNRAC